MDNREIFNKNYSESNARLDAPTEYDRRIIDLRLGYIRKYGTGKDVLDLGCGAGAYSIPLLDNMKSVVGVDFSSTMIHAYADKFKGGLPENLCLIEGDARQIPLKSSVVDFVFSFITLYAVPNVGEAIAEIARVLRPGGFAAIELGNHYSISTVLAYNHHVHDGWARPQHIPFSQMKRHIADAGFREIERRSFQLMPMYGVPKRLFYMLPVAGAFWKKIMGARVGEKMLDEWISGSWPLRHIAFRHFFLMEKK